MGEVCWNYNPQCNQKCSYPNPNCYWIKQAQYNGPNRTYVPSSPTKKINENKLEEEIKK